MKMYPGQKQKELRKNQIGCGYCSKEKTCKIRDPKVNKAKQGCKDWRHWENEKPKIK